MPNRDLIAQLTPQITAWRRDFHENPELGYDVFRTADLVAERLKSFGVDEVVTGIGQTGVVGVIHGKNRASGKVIGLRADMDALPIAEETNKPYASKIEGKMHACGHDGHTAMLLGAAQYLASTRDFDGTAVVIFQPAEEGFAGGKAMVDDGMMERFGIQEVYGMHNYPDLPLGQFAIRQGPMLAAADRLEILVEGRGGHAAKPHECVDTILVASHIVNALQTIVARNVDPLLSAVVSITAIHAGDTFNVIPQTCKMLGTARTLDPEVRDFVERRITEVAEATAKAHGARAVVEYVRNYPVTWNHPAETVYAAQAASALVGAEKVDVNAQPIMGGEDFSFMLNARPGSFIFMGNGASAGLHHPAYDFNDEAIPYGVAYWAQLVEHRLAA